MVKDNFCFVKIGIVVLVLHQRIFFQDEVKTGLRCYQGRIHGLYADFQLFYCPGVKSVSKDFRYEQDEVPTWKDACSLDADFDLC